MFYTIISTCPKGISVDMEREYYLKLTSIYQKLMQMYFILPFKYGFSNNKEKNINRDVLNLYKKYLQLLIKYQEAIPCLENDYKLKNVSCYLYALGLSIPSIFKNVYESLLPWQFGADPGEISGYNAFVEGWTKEELMERLYADLDTLKIKVYPSTITSSINHDGYKIACFLDKDGKDFHFARQNSNGIWSQKMGFNKKIYIDNDPTAFLHLSKDYKYELIKTLELVKPGIRR